MADYIDRESAIKLLTSVALEVSDSKRRAVAKCINEIEMMPAADVEPVRHGRWIVPIPPDNYTYCKCVCSVCNHTAGKHKTLYYPNCGAKMDGGNGKC